MSQQMSQQMIIEGLKGYISNEILDGQDIDLDGSTPLIEWGIINSMEIARLVAFIEDRYGVEIPSDKITLDQFRNLDALSTLVLEQRQA
jgi:acyl carrier protein